MSFEKSLSTFVLSPVRQEGWRVGAPGGDSAGDIVAPVAPTPLQSPFPTFEKAASPGQHRSRVWGAGAPRDVVQLYTSRGFALRGLGREPRVGETR